MKYILPVLIAIVTSFASQGQKTQTALPTAEESAGLPSNAKTFVKPVIPCFEVT